jgi:hypothetical protein
MLFLSKLCPNISGETPEKCGKMTCCYDFSSMYIQQE